ncbi:MAG: hypothetical protein JEZ09_19385 [Salinivirgaceae bacterium]|nr:hypothetical protein [Salinivirgaceae bacterium]
MCDCKLLKKEHVGSGNYNWTFKCKKDGKEVVETAGNEQRARTLAELSCDDKKE